MSISDIFAVYGEEYFRNLETDLLVELQEKSNVIISCGGGTPLRDNNVAEMKKNGRVVLLTAKPETIYERIRNSHDRPLLETVLFLIFKRRFYICPESLPSIFRFYKLLRTNLSCRTAFGCESVFQTWNRNRKNQRNRSALHGKSRSNSHAEQKLFSRTERFSSNRGEQSFYYRT